jgi:hypothetical protein
MMEAAGTSETLVNFYLTTWRNIPEDSHPHFNIILPSLFQVVAPAKFRQYFSFHTP